MHLLVSRYKEALVFPTEADVEEAIQALNAAHDAVEEVCGFSAIHVFGEGRDPSEGWTWMDDEQQEGTVAPVTAENIAALALIRDDLATALDSFQRFASELDRAMHDALYVREMQRTVPRGDDAG